MLTKTKMKGKLDSDRIQSLLRKSSLELSSYDSMASDEERERLTGPDYLYENKQGASKSRALQEISTFCRNFKVDQQ